MAPTPSNNRLRRRNSVTEKQLDDDVREGEQPPAERRRSSDHGGQRNLSRRSSDHGGQRNSSKRGSDKLKTSLLTDFPPDASEYIDDAGAPTGALRKPSRRDRDKLKSSFIASDVPADVGAELADLAELMELPKDQQVSAAQWYKPSRATSRQVPQEEQPEAPSDAADANDDWQEGEEDGRPRRRKSSPPILLGLEDDSSAELEGGAGLSTEVEVGADSRVQDRGRDYAFASLFGDVPAGKSKGGSKRRIGTLSIVIAVAVLAVVASIGKLARRSPDTVPANFPAPTRLGTHHLGGESEGKEGEEEYEEEEEEDYDEPDESGDLELSQQRTGSLVAQQFTADPHAHRSKVEMILNGELSLAGVRYSPNSFAVGREGDEGNAYTGVYGDFCVFDSRLNKEDPSYYPDVKDAMAESSHCGEHQYAIPLREVMDAVKKNSGDGSKEMRALPVSGLLFHQGHAGAGLLANVLTAFKSTHVISKHSAVHDALSACDVIRNRHRSADCSLVKQRQLVRDVVELLSRTSDTSIRHLFLKLDSASAAYLPSLRALYPDARWTFSYRDAEEVLSKSVEQDRSAACARARRNPTSALAEKSREQNVELEGLSHFEACALHLSTLLETAVEEHERTGTGMLVPYEDVVATSGKVLVEKVLPYLGLQEEWNEANEVSSSENLEDRVTDILLTRSNSRGIHAGKQREWDKSMEDVVISEEVRGAAQLFMGNLMSGSKK